jgi:hypothetical protein
MLKLFLPFVALFLLSLSGVGRVIWNSKRQLTDSPSRL